MTSLHGITKRDLHQIQLILCRHTRVLMEQILQVFLFFFLNDPATPEFYPLPLHDALPIWASAQADAARIRREAETARAAAQAETERLRAQAAQERASLDAARAAADEANRLRAQSEQEKEIGRAHV